MEERRKNYLSHELDIFFKLPRKIQELLWFDLRDGEMSKQLFNVAYNFETYEQCESPIEIIFAYYWDKYFLEKRYDKQEDVYFIPQETITTDNNKNYRVDFWIEYYRLEGNTAEESKEYCCEVIIECDGHDFHEKTKGQVKKRNERDYDLKMSGYDVIHFSGSEIYNNPEECVEKVVEYLKKNAKPKLANKFNGDN